MMTNSDDKWSRFWLAIAKEIKKSYGYGHPSQWEESVISEFLNAFELSIKEKISRDDDLATKCGVKYKGLQVDQWKSMVPSTFRRIFSYRSNAGKLSTRNSFAIYFGYRSAEDYIQQKGLNKMTGLERELPLLASPDNSNWKKSTLDVSNKFLTRCLQLGLDAALISEVKRVINTQLAIDKAEHFMEIHGTTVKVRAKYKGRYVGDRVKEYFHFNPVAAVPCYPDEMKVYARNLRNQKDLELTTQDDDLSNSKNYQLFFDKPLQNGEGFEFEFGYSLPKTAKNVGRDYLLSVLAFEESVKSYRLQITFFDKSPKFLKLINAYEEVEADLEPQDKNDRVEFSYNLTSKDIKSLNNLRLLILYNKS